MIKCPSCNQRKGKRSCPALRARICSNCCGSKQLRQIACPADCDYLLSGREYREIRHYQRRLEGPDGELFERVLVGLQHPLQSLQRSLVRSYRVFRGFDDSAALEAVKKVLETCETESRGVIFEQRSTDPQAQAAIQDLLKEIAGLRRGQTELGEGAPVKLAEIILCLKFLEKDIATLLAKGKSPTAYLEFLVGAFPETPRSTHGLIIPG